EIPSAEMAGKWTAAQRGDTVSDPKAGFRMPARCVSWQHASRPAVGRSQTASGRNCGICRSPMRLALITYPPSSVSFFDFLRAAYQRGLLASAIDFRDHPPNWGPDVSVVDLMPEIEGAAHAD